jgi:hypothetical protein
MYLNKKMIKKNKNKLSVKIMGGLGNQMFQWAFGRNLSLINNSDLRLETSWYSTKNYDREFKLNKFPNIKIEFLDGSENIVRSIHEPDDFIYLDISDIGLPTIFVGYWQNEKYFKKNINLIIKDFSMTEEKKSELINKYKIVEENSVSVHFRRGDYITNPNHPVLSNNYYLESLEKIKNYDNIIVFSDDIEWCKKNFKLPKITYVEGLNNIDSLWLMSLCKNNIIANSSFSWWAAYLNQNINKKIIRPKIWFSPNSSIDSSQICPYDWDIV